MLTLLTANLVVASPYKTIPMNQKQLATYYVDASLTGTGDVEFMVDTGAESEEDSAAKIIRTLELMQLIPAVSTSEYSDEEEGEIRQRLADLGYI